MLESIEGLRDYIKEHYNMGSYAYDEIMSQVQATEREIAENYIERDKAIEAPSGADNVPIRYGDKLRSDELPGREFTCLGFNVTQLNGVPWWTVEWRYDGESGTSEYVSAKSCHHVKPRTLDSILDDIEQQTSITCDARIKAKKIIELTNELHELLGGDAE